MFLIEKLNINSVYIKKLKRSIIYLIRMLKKIFLEKFHHWFDNTKLHGVPLLKISEKKHLKILWLIYFFASFTICGFYLVNDINSYFKYDIETIIEVSRDTNIRFPTISFCYLQLCNKEVKEEEKLYKKNDSISKLKIINCLFSSDFCSENDFEYYELDESHSCLKFNGNYSNPKLSRRFGKGYGLDAELFLDQNRNCTKSLSVYLHNASNLIDSNAFGIQLSSGTETNIAVDRTFISRKPKPYSNCIDQIDEESSDLVIETFDQIGIYSQATCFKLCKQELYFKLFGCYSKYLPRLKNQPNITCDNEKNKEIKDANVDNKCYQKCPKECEFVKYDLTVSSALFPTETYVKMLMYNENVTNNFDLEYQNFEDEYQKALSSILSVKIYFKSDLVKIVREKPLISTEAFIANIGGTLGLFLGLSLISILEFIEFLVEICIIYVHSIIQKRKNKVHNFTK